MERRKASDITGAYEYPYFRCPQTPIADVTVPNDYEEFARETWRLTPGLLGEELAKFFDYHIARGYGTPYLI